MICVTLRLSALFSALVLPQRPGDVFRDQRRTILPSAFEGRDDLGRGSGVAQVVNGHPQPLLFPNHITRRDRQIRSQKRTLAGIGRTGAPPRAGRFGARSVVWVWDGDDGESCDAGEVAWLQVCRGRSLARAMEAFTCCATPWVGFHPLCGRFGRPWGFAVQSTAWGAAASASDLAPSAPVDACSRTANGDCCGVPCLLARRGRAECDGFTTRS